MTVAFHGDLFWINEHQAFSRVVVDILEISGNEEHVWIQLRSSGQGRDDSKTPYRISTRAKPPERFEYDHYGRRVIPVDPRQKVYRTSQCQVYQHDITNQAILELRFRLLSNEDEKRFCFLRLDWINADDPESTIYSAQGLLEECDAPYGDNFSDGSISR